MVVLFLNLMLVIKKTIIEDIIAYDVNEKNGQW